MNIEPNSYWHESSRRKIIRIIAGYIAIIFIIPYLIIKIAWIFGFPLGMPNASMISKPSIISLNIITFCMDVVAVLLALTISHRWGRNVSGWLVLFPIWIGIGFLTPIIMAAPISVIVRLLISDTSQNIATGQFPLAPWVRAIVFTSFTGQGLALIISFTLYVIARWNRIVKLQMVYVSSFRPSIVKLSQISSIIAVGVGILHFLWAFGFSSGLSEQVLNKRGASFYQVHLVFGMLPLVATTGIISLVSRKVFNKVWIPLILLWIGAGGMFTWGSWLLLADVLGASGNNILGLAALANMAMSLTGLVIAVLMWKLLNQISH